MTSRPITSSSTISTASTASTVSTSRTARSSAYAKKAGTKLIRDTFKGNPTIGLWDVDDKGKVVGKAPIISFGYNKVKAILDHMEEIQLWAKEQEEAKELATAAVSTNQENSVKFEDLSPSDLAAIHAILTKLKK